MLTTTLSYAATMPVRLGIPHTNVDPGVSPNWDVFPFMGWLKDMVGGLQAVLLIIAVAGLLLAIIGLVFSKVASSRGGSSLSATVLLVCGLGAIGIAGASGIIAWFAGQNVGF